MHNVFLLKMSFKRYSLTYNVHLYVNLIWLFFEGKTAVVKEMRYESFGKREKICLHFSFSGSLKNLKFSLIKRSIT